MHINVSDILAESVGFSREFAVVRERPVLDGITLASDINGRLSVMRLDEGVAVNGRLTTEVELECDRCLRSFTMPVTLGLQQVFTEHPGDDQLPIDRHGTIDLAPLVTQEIVLGLPIKLLCRPDCPGIETNPAHQMKGTTRGRTKTTNHS